MLTSTPATDIAPATVHWLWETYIARGKLAILDGDPGTGKSFVALDHAADTIRPRVSAAGADLSRVHVVTALGMDLAPLPQFPADVPDLGQLIRFHAADLVVLDPLLPFFPREVWANHDESVRRALTPLAVTASDTRCAVLCVRHLTKTGGSKAIYRGGGSIGIVGAMRTALLLSPHPDDDKLIVLATTKTNVGVPGRSLGMRLVPHASGETVVSWGDPLDLTANDLCGGGERVRPRDRAKDWLRDQLANGRRKATDIEAAAKAAGIAHKTLLRAKDALGVVSEQTSGDTHPEWWWYDPATSAPTPQSNNILPPLEDLMSARFS